MNNTTNSSWTGQQDEQESTLIAQSLVSSVGVFVLILNGVLTMYLLGILFRPEEKSFFLQLLFISVNDILCGVSFLILGMFEVHSMFTSTVCIYIMVLTLTLISTSHINVLFICLYRYVRTRNISQINSNWKDKYTKVLGAMTVSLGVALIVVYRFIGGDVEFRREGSCQFDTTLTADASRRLMLAVIAVLISTIIVADVFSVISLAIVKKTVNRTSQPEQNMGVTPVHNDKNVRSYQTLLMLVVSYNISLIPLVVLSLSIAAGVDPTLLLRRVAMWLLQFNGLINPIICCCRVQRISTLMFDDLKAIKRRCCT